MRLRSHRDRKTGLLLTITLMTDGKWRFSFENAAQNQIASPPHFAPTIQSPANRKQTTKEK
jgi:hypothetical protein